VSHRPSGSIRLGCIYCDRDDGDGISEIPADWSDVHEVQPLVESRRPVAEGELHLRSVFDWQTHLGVCPACQAAHRS